MVRGRLLLMPLAILTMAGCCLLLSFNTVFMAFAGTSLATSRAVSVRTQALAVDHAEIGYAQPIGGGVVSQNKHRRHSRRDGPRQGRRAILTKVVRKFKKLIDDSRTKASEKVLTKRRK
mmetsp:Transcript_16488/g.32230  ORF Transcript_16488/g.32230 Transcript_16488/m.32230 type:complete len:119 (-) Transcript_16488:14-370(-)